MDVLFRLLNMSMSGSETTRRLGEEGESILVAPTTSTMHVFPTSRTRFGESSTSEEPPVSNICTNCGVDALDLCACPCGQATYCSTECQWVHWSVHRQVCWHGRKGRHMPLLSCYYCSRKSYTLRQCPCGLAVYCDRDCQIADWPRHRATCARSGPLKKPLHVQHRTDVAVQTESVSGELEGTAQIKALTPRRGTNVRFAPMVAGHRVEWNGNPLEGKDFSSVTVGGSSSTTNPVWRPSEARGGLWKGFRDAAAQQASRTMQQETGFIDFDCVDCESEASTSSDKDNIQTNDDSGRFREDPAHKRSTVELQYPLKGFKGSSSLHNPLELPVGDNPLITVPIRTTFDTLPGLASYLANQNKDSGIIVVLASFANSIAEETAARRMISNESKREHAELMRRFVLGRVRIALSEMSTQEERERKNILTDSILWRRKTAYPAYKELQKLLGLHHYHQ
ncbi:hypothetical protein DQ04_00611160 [Trypanosoma grayi]|uniref:hypothetical protein n=1 Tax=Trypanosoma grayi TaxID=71804 RepID=UPI0004F440EA|nr:hypothetical protein DQ04_00611160 [Trypanosoma grayi]KEG14129.1 hypothetical protein DQ04_00611160 [Trypanosoma grayi]